MKDTYVANEMTLPKTVYTYVADQTPRGIEDFLRRPVILAQGSWNTTQAATVSLGAWSFPDAVFNQAFNAQILNKILGYTLMKARMRIRLQVNSQPSYAGILLLSYVPHADYMTSKVQSLYSTLTSLTGCSHVTMNISNSTSLEFVTPYISPHVYVNLATGQGTFGRVNLQVMSPLTIGGGVLTPVTWTMWVSFEDIELRVPTNAQPAYIYAQVGGELSVSRKTGMISGGIGTVGRVVSGVLPALGLKALAQPVEALASTASGIARMFGFSKPLAQAPSTLVVQRPMRGHLNVDGCETGANLGSSVATELQTLTGFAGTDEDEMSLSYIASRPSAIDNFAWRTASAQDEVLETYTVTPTALMWRAKTSTPVLPRTKNAEVRMTHAAFLADKYHYWRGDIVYTFHFAKTQLHSGRLRFNFKPYVGAMFQSVSENLNACPGFTITEDVDLATTSTFRFKIPYVSSRPWMLTQWPQMNSPSSAVVDAKNFALGEIEIVVLNQLTAMSTVANAVDVVVFGHMEDAAFAVPRRSRTLPNLASLPAVARMMEDYTEVGENTARRYTVGEWESSRTKRSVRETITREEEEEMSNEIVAQVGGEEAKPLTETEHASDVPLLPPAICQGEVHTSIRQALKRYNLVAYVRPEVVAPVDGRLGSDGNWVVLRPWAAASNSQLALSSTTAQNWGTTYNDFYSACYGNYAFYRGSMRFRVVWDEPVPNSALSMSTGVSAYLVYPSDRQPAINPLWARPEEYPYGSSAITGIALENMRLNPVVSRFNNISSAGPSPTKVPPTREDGWESISIAYVEGGIEFQVPYYSSSYMSTAAYHRYNGDFWAAQRNGVVPLPLVILGSNFWPKGNFSVFRAVGDDFSFGGLVGVPRSTAVLEPGPQAPETDPEDAKSGVKLGPYGIS